VGPEAWELEWSPAGPGVRLRGSPLWFDAWPASGVGFLSSLDALARRRVRGQVLCLPGMVPLVKALRPGVRVLPLVGAVGFGRLRLEARATGIAPGTACLLVERGPGRLGYLREGDEAFLEAWRRDAGGGADTLLWASRERRSEGLTAPGRPEREATDDAPICLVVEGPGEALGVLAGLGATPGPVWVSARVHALCREVGRQGLPLPPVRTWDGRSPIPPGGLSLWVASARRALPEAVSAGLVRLRAREAGEGAPPGAADLPPTPGSATPGALARAFRAVGAVRLVLTGPGAPAMERGLAGLGIRAEVLGPPLETPLF